LYALALALGTPFLVIGLSRLPHKTVLLGLLTLFLVGNLVAALSSNYAVLLFGCIVTTVASSLAPKGQAGRAIAVMLAGLTLAMVIGVPLGSSSGPYRMQASGALLLYREDRGLGERCRPIAFSRVYGRVGESSAAPDCGWLHCERECRTAGLQRHKEWAFRRLIEYTRADTRA
jgi:hypothetical protein